MKCYMSFRYTKRGIFTIFKSSYANKLHRVMQDKRVVTDFRHLNVRIAKNNLAYPLVRDTFSVLGNSKCEVLFGIRSKRCISFLRVFWRFKRYCGILPFFVKCLIFMSKNSYGIEHLSFNFAIVYKCNLRSAYKA